ncbi:MAG TPA: spermidine/putrescine ABC transporter substrate-binding protein [Acidobacteriota bacterium]|nr:spermidine/putrescine ABC transporter substrate-binding protein [Acidobacteriota bacterium]
MLALLCFACGVGQKDRQLNVFIWSAYISQPVLDQFEKQTGIRVRYDTYDSNQALLEKLRAGVTEYDVICPTNWLITSLIRLKLIDKLDASRIPNRKNISPSFQDSAYDRGNQYSIPFLWGIDGIGYNKTKVTGPLDSWSVLWDPQYKNRISMLDNAGDCFLAALKWRGHSINSSVPAELQEARDLLLAQKPLVRTYNSSNFDELLLSGDVWIAYGYSGQLAKATEQNPDLVYIVPREGSLVWMDTLAIPANAPHKDAAYAFLNFCLDPKIAAEITNNTGYANANEASKPFVKPAILSNPARYPSDDTLKRCEWSIDQPELDKIKDRYWTEIKAH